MRCPSCNHDNRAERRFCADCGAALAVRCAACGGSNEPGEKFCGGCGERLSPALPPAASQLASLPLTRAPAALPELAPAVGAPAPPRPRHRLAAVDWLLLGTLLPICVFGLVMTVVHGVRGDFVRLPWPHNGWLESARDTEAYPIVRRVDSSAAGSLIQGDRLLGLEGESLRGESFAGYIVRESRFVRGGARSLRFTIERGGARSEVRVPLVPGYRSRGVPWWAILPFIVGTIGAALLLLVRAADTSLARRFYVAMLLAAFSFTPYFWVPTMPWAMITTFLLVLPATFWLALWILCEFIPGVHLWGVWQKTVACSLALLQFASFAALCWSPDTGFAAVLMRLSDLPLVGFVIAWLVTLAQGYRRAGPLGRRQIKWVVYGFYAGTVPMAVAGLTSNLGVVLDWRPMLFGVGLIALSAVPLGFLVAIAFYQFLDIDRLFSATLSYSVLAILGLALVLGVMPVASQAASDALGLAPAYGQILFAFALAAIVVPAQRVLRPRIDRLLFPQRLALEQGFEHLLAAISGCADMQELTRLVGERLDALLQPEAAIVYARAQAGDDVFTPLAVRGRTAPPAFAAQSALIAALQERTMPLAAERWTARRSTSLTPFERAAIETLDVAVLVPFRRGPDLVAFSCLGPKQSGDIYTPTDLAWLGAVAGKVSDRLLALDATAVAEQARVMQDALRRYVPAAVAERLASGQDIEAGEREVTVLFVDIRGYTGFSEARQAEEIFHTVNRYTEMVSQVVRARGGSVVEFHGDGLLAVFGAPDEIPTKERAAVQAGCEIIAGMAEMAAPARPPEASGVRATSLSNVSNLPARSEPTASGQPTGTPAAGPLSVGVGIGTGPAFVGNIQSSDRFIWTVIGDTVNLAARLQSMTRELDAAVAIDDTTFRRAGQETCAAFVRHADLAIRGRAQPETVHALPL